MAVTFRSQAGVTGSGNFTPVRPAGTVTGDLLIMHLCYEKGNTVSFGGPGAAQWTLLQRADNSSNIGTAVWYRHDDGSTLSQVNLTGGPKYTLTVASYFGHDPDDPTDVATTANGSSGHPNPPAITPTVAPSLAIIVCGNKKAPTGTAPSGYTERWDRANTSEGLSWTWGGEKALTTTSTEDPAVVTASETEAWGAITFNINEAPPAGRTVECTTETLSCNETQSTVLRLVPRVVACQTEAAILAENAASIARTRSMQTDTESLGLAENSASVARDRGVSASIEQLSLTENTAQVVTNVPLVVTCATEALAVAENSALVAADRAVGTTTEVLSLNEAASIVSRDLTIAALTEALATAQNAAAIRRDRGVNTSIEQLTLTESTAQVTGSTNQVVNCTTEGLSLSESLATILTARGVNTSVEQLSLTENTAQIVTNVPLVVTCATEALAVTENSASVIKDLVVQATTSTLTVTFTTASAARSRSVSSITEELGLVEIPALVSAGRDINTVVEMLALVETGATILRGANLAVTCSTQALSIAEQTADIARSRVASCFTELVALAPTASNAGRARGAQASTKTFELTANSATIVLPGPAIIAVQLVFTLHNAPLFREQHPFFVLGPLEHPFYVLDTLEDQRPFPVFDTLVDRTMLVGQDKIFWRRVNNDEYIHSLTSRFQAYVG